jgi:hypothetical protein
LLHGTRGGYRDQTCTGWNAAVTGCAKKAKKSAKRARKKATKTKGKARASATGDDVKGYLLRQR